MNRTLLSLVVVLSLFACKKEVAVAPMGEPAMPAAPAADAAGARVEAIATLRKNFQKVYFDLDSAELNEPSKSALAANAAILGEYPRLSIEVQGHADERGTTDYNLALGQRRASAVRNLLIEEGVSPKRVKLASYGEEKPVATGANESSWSQNRRAEFRIVDGADASVAGTTE
jgi:peptidoglycan-associated lipoprotein